MANEDRFPDRKSGYYACTFKNESSTKLSILYFKKNESYDSFAVIELKSDDVKQFIPIGCCGSLKLVGDKGVVCLLDMSQNKTWGNLNEYVNILNECMEAANFQNLRLKIIKHVTHDPNHPDYPQTTVDDKDETYLTFLFENAHY